MRMGKKRVRYGTLARDMNKYFQFSNNVMLLKVTVYP